MKSGNEWIIANKNGYYSYSTTSLANTRSYHGLFVSLNEDFSRTVYLSKIWEEIIIGEKTYYLDTNLFGDIIHPDGYSRMREHTLFPTPTFTFQTEGTTIRKEIFWHPTKNSLFIRYSISDEIPDSVRLVPLIGIRDAGSMNRITPYQYKMGEQLTVERDGKNLNIRTDGTFRSKEEWYRNFTYDEEKTRGYACSEDLYTPGYFEFGLPVEINLQVSNEEERIDPGTAKELYLKQLMPKLRKDIFPEQFQHISDIFSIGDSIIAGFPWFGSWSRDAFISLPGLLLVRKKYAVAKSVLERFKEKFPDGKFTSYIGEKSTPSDSPLWYIYSVKKYMDYTNDLPFLESVLEFCKLIVENYIEGYNGIRIEDSLVHSPPGSTWMDGNCNGQFETPREGKTVEVNALWYNSLLSLREFYVTTRKEFPDKLSGLIQTTRDEFHKKFVYNDSVKDIADPDDHSIRPNMLLAFSLPYPVLENFRNYKKSVTDLVTPYGLRSLSPSDKRFVGIYWGDQCSRDRAYHNGTIWPWLIGPYVSASVRSGSSKDRLRTYFGPLLKLNYVPEIFDGFQPSEPRGCIVQAWSYAEILRSFSEDLS